ncbi:hypothetical protein D3C76_1215060 [compost metagenome]
MRQHLIRHRHTQPTGSCIQGQVIEVEHQVLVSPLRLIVMRLQPQVPLMPPGRAMDQCVTAQRLERAGQRLSIAEGGRTNRHKILIEQHRQRPLIKPFAQIQHIRIAIPTGLHHLATDRLDGQAQRGIERIETAQPR